MVCAVHAQCGGRARGGGGRIDAVEGGVTSKQGATMTRSMWTLTAMAAATLLTCGLLVATAALAAADDKDKKPAEDKADAKNLLKDANKPESWRLEEHESAKGTMKADE